MSDFIRQHQKNSLKGALGYDQPSAGSMGNSDMQPMMQGDEYAMQPYASGLRSLQGGMDGNGMQSMMQGNEYDMALKSMQDQLLKGRR